MIKWTPTIFLRHETRLNISTFQKLETWDVKKFQGMRMMEVGDWGGKVLALNFFSVKNHPEVYFLKLSAISEYALLHLSL